LAIALCADVTATKYRDYERFEQSGRLVTVTEARLQDISIGVLMNSNYQATDVHFTLYKIQNSIFAFPVQEKFSREETFFPARKGMI